MSNVNEFILLILVGSDMFNVLCNKNLFVS